MSSPIRDSFATKQESTISNQSENSPPYSTCQMASLIMICGTELIMVSWRNQNRISQFISVGKHRPIVILKGIVPKQKPSYHAVVLLGKNPNGKLLVKNSLAGTIVFQGKTQQPKHEVEDKITNTPNQWNLAHPCPGCPSCQANCCPHRKYYSFIEFC